MDHYIIQQSPAIHHYITQQSAAMDHFLTQHTPAMDHYITQQSPERRFVEMMEVFEVNWANIIQRLVCQQKDFEDDAILNGEPIEVMKERSDMIVFLFFVISFAAAFCTRCSCDFSSVVVPANRALLASSFDIT